MKSTKTNDQENARKSAWDGEENESLWTMLVICGMAALTFGVNVGRCAMLGQDVICFFATAGASAVAWSCGKELKRRSKNRRGTENPK